MAEQISLYVFGVASGLVLALVYVTLGIVIATRAERERRWPE